MQVICLNQKKTLKTTFITYLHDNFVIVFKKDYLKKTIIDRFSFFESGSFSKTIVFFEKKTVIF